MRLSLSTYGSRGDVEPLVGQAVQSWTLRARGAEMPMCAPPDFAELLARVGVPLLADSMMPAMQTGGWL